MCTHFLCVSLSGFLYVAVLGTVFYSTINSYRNNSKVIKYNNKRSFSSVKYKCVHTFCVSLCRGFFMLLFLWTVCYSTINIYKNSNKAIMYNIADLIARLNINVYTLSVCLFVGFSLCCCFYGQFAIVP